METLVYSKHTLKEANYSYVEYLGNGEHLLKNDVTEELEVWAKNKNHAGYSLIYKNTHLEFCRTFKG
jgi:hypothetical protein